MQRPQVEGLKILSCSMERPCLDRAWLPWMEGGERIKSTVSAGAVDRFRLDASVINPTRLLTFATTDRPARRKASDPARQ